MIEPQQMTAVLVTKGGYDIEPVLETLKPFAEIIVWDNGAKTVTSYYGGGFISERVPDAKVYGRYLGALRARFDTVYVQDDDCVTDPLEILRIYNTIEDPANLVLCNMTPQHAVAPYYRWRIKLVGFGAIFNKKLIQFGPYLRAYDNDQLFQIECDRVFTALNDSVICQVPIGHSEYASDQDRLWKQADHGGRMREIESRLKGLLG